MKNFHSNFFDDVDDLIQAKDDAWKNVQDRRDRLATVRKFTNMMNTLSEEEAEKMNRTEITNHGLTHRNMLQNETQFTSMVTVTNSLVDIVVDTDNPEKDIVTGMRISSAINRGAIHFKGKFANFWHKVAGELVIAGGCPVTQNEKYGWLPKLRTDMFFPKETGLDAEEVTYCFDPTELSISDLKKLAAAVRGDEGKYIDKKRIEKLIEAIEKQIKNNTRDAGSSFTEETTKSTRETSASNRIITISAFWYYEVKCEKDKQYVSATLFMDTVNGVQLPESYGKAACIIAYFDKAHDEATDWLHNVYVDSEIGGIKNMDTLKGVAEMSYPSNLEMEELLNLMMEGDKIRARPKMRLTERADADAIAKWDVVSDLFAPDGVEEMEFKGNSRGLMTPMELLAQNSAGMTGGAHSNTARGGELRQQALERQQNTAMLQTNRVSQAYNHLDSILETVVWRILAGPVKAGTDGYREIMWIRAELDKYQIPYKQLAERKYGRFQYLRVRARRSIGNGDRQQQIETADWLMANIQSYDPQVRPQIIHKATILRTQDPDEADNLVKLPQAIINAQKVTAENEYDTIKRRAALGQVLPTGQDDIHQDHIPVHLLDMQAHVAQHALRPWDKMDVLSFAGMVEHVSEHLKILMTNPVTNAEGAQFIQDFQNIAQAAQAIVAEVEEKSGSEANQLTAKEQADMELKWAQFNLAAAQVGIRVEDMQRLWQNREARANLSRRQQFAREINEDRRLKLDKERIEVQASAQNERTKNAKESE